MQVLKRDIRLLSAEELLTAMAQLGEKSFRAKQVYEWLWKKSCTSFDEMTNLSLDLREKLKANFDILQLQKNIEQKSEDGTVKLGFQLHDNRLIEGVLIPTTDRTTACVSSQVGCTLQCAFCATGFLKRERNLEPAEIYDQIVALNKISIEQYARPLSNIVFMGMGEPLLNIDNVLGAIEKVTSPEGLGMSPTRITLSTVGIARQIMKLADLGVRFNLALSLHAATDEKRSAIMPINKSNPIDELMDALLYFYKMTGNKITFEYILFDGVNDSVEDALALVKLCKKVPSFVNIIEYNAVEGVSFVKANEEKRRQFVAVLANKGITAKVRLSRGKDIDAACGQLANKAQQDSAL